MNRVIALAVVMLGIVAMSVMAPSGPVRADNEPLLWPDGTITYRDWGMYRPGLPVLIERPYRYGGGIVSKNEGASYFPGSYSNNAPAPARDPDFYPSNQRDPNAYRAKPQIRPVAPEPYYRSWGTGSDSAPAPATDPAPEGPSVIVAPEVDVNRRRR
ncbi:hypothetical protein [Pseudorhodoplanes sp.]|uniref:hypothetical protein n=1 Tax=Pseudorhodoplanes sp. TaxID=1934341 RepID=UPI002C0D80FA|nr:hypothetical protein [Pseudorhodoplanes sp.]HWV55325.1 hypothetical protein [Pseudorhodoplanes sp.]